MIRGMKKQFVYIDGVRIKRYVYLNHANKSFAKVDGKFIEVIFNIYGRYWMDKVFTG